MCACTVKDEAVKKIHGEDIDLHKLILQGN